MAKLRGSRHFLNIPAHIREQPIEIELLLVVGATNGAFRLPCDGQHRDVVQLCIIEARNEVGGARSTR
jgi:hypothetical protein